MVLIYKKRVYPIVVACLVSPKYIQVSVVNFHLHCGVPLLREFKNLLTNNNKLYLHDYIEIW